MWISVPVSLFTLLDRIAWVLPLPHMATTEVPPMHRFLNSDLLPFQFQKPFFGLALRGMTDFSEPCRLVLDTTPSAKFYLVPQ